MYIAQLIEKAERFGLKEVSTPRQKKNHTIMFVDAKTGDNFGIYLKTGYVRRLYKIKNHYVPSLNGSTAMYQLNPVVTKSDGYCNRSTRIVFPNDPEKLFAILFKRFEKRGFTTI